MNLWYNIPMIQRKGGEIVKQLIPGTVIPIGNGIEQNNMLSNVIATTKGLMLSQVCELTGLEMTTLQNWVKRGWVSNAKDKRYSKKQVARILIINLLRSCLRLEDIAFLLQYINGAVDDVSDDSIDESELYEYLCRSIARLQNDGACDGEELDAYVTSVLATYEPRHLGDEERLEKALMVMLLAYQSGMLKRLAEDKLLALKTQ